MIRCESCPTSQSLKQVFNDNIIRFSFSSSSSIPWHQTHLHHFGQNPYHHQQPIHSRWIHQSCRDLARQWRELSYGSVGELSWYSSLYCRAKSSSKATGAKLSSLAGHNVKGAPYLALPRGPSHPVQPVHRVAKCQIFYTDKNLSSKIYPKNA